MVAYDADCGGADYARDKGIPIVVFPRRKDGQDVFLAEDLVITLRSDFILLKAMNTDVMHFKRLYVLIQFNFPLDIPSGVLRSFVTDAPTYRSPRLTLIHSERKESDYKNLKDPCTIQNISSIKCSVVLFYLLLIYYDNEASTLYYLTCRSYKVDFILLAGYLKLIPVELVQAYPKSILNIHPSLLPAFGGKGYYGMKVHKAVIASGARYSGPTIHYVDEQYDTGRILAQRVVPVLANDTAEELAARVLHEEHKLYVEVAAALCEERITWREDGVPLIRSKENPNDTF
ncbi:UNVERIFIED_CONTAM: Phosphoribosylglycinamide formyltransferase, chloroplastic [Sesamum latifolium]|uniref:phosphoribosylglycinamide formyltransferase 1 n=1 Tax=Sesamum latifolium TaxID=2727402 RepID=A0AAW2TQJ8_9LAMI